VTEKKEKAEPTIAGIPTLEYYQKTYAVSMDQNDQKAVQIFKDYEAHEKFRRMQQEVMWVRDEKVKTMVLDRVLGKKRKSKYESYKRWAELMLLWMAGAKK